MDQISVEKDLSGCNKERRWAEGGAGSRESRLKVTADPRAEMPQGWS